LLTKHAHVDHSCLKHRVAGTCLLPYACHVDPRGRTGVINYFYRNWCVGQRGPPQEETRMQTRCVWCLGVCVLYIVACAEERGGREGGAGGLHPARKKHAYSVCTFVRVPDFPKIFRNSMEIRMPRPCPSKEARPGWHLGWHLGGCVVVGPRCYTLVLAFLDGRASLNSSCCVCMGVRVCLCSSARA
jgi:hypothetical protein